MKPIRPPSEQSGIALVVALILLVMLLLIGFWPKSISDTLNAALVAAPARVAATR